jgi:hypothetical protein
MGPIGHTFISGAVGVGVGAATGSPKAGALALGFGVLMDADHLYDFYQWYVKGRPNRVFVFFHAWEYSVAGLLTLAVWFFHPLLLAVVLAHLAHVTADHFHNRLTPFAYFITYRLLKKFDRAFIAPQHSVTGAYRAWPHLLPFGRLLQPWFQRRIEPWFDERVRRGAGAQEGVHQSEV